MQKVTTSPIQPTSSHWQLGGWALWAIAALYYSYEFVHRVAPSILTQHLRVAFAVNDHQLASIGAVYFYAYAAFQLPAGVLIDRFGVKRILTLAAAILTLGSFSFTLTHSSFIAHLSRFMIGAGSAFAFVGCLKIGAQWLSRKTFPLVVGLTNLAGTLGALLGGYPLSYLVSYLGWREAMLVLSFIGLVITLLVGLFVEDKKSSVIEAKAHGMLSGLMLVMKTPQSWLIGIYGALLVAPIAALPEMWGVEFLKISYQLSDAKAATITHTIFIGTALGGPLIGWLMTHIRSEIDFMMFASLGALSLLCIFLYWVNLPLVKLYFILFCYGLLTAHMLLCFALVTELHPPSAQGAAIGFINMIIMASAGLAQHSVGFILNYLHSQHANYSLASDYHIALSILPVCIIMALFLTFFMKRNFKFVEDSN